MKRFLLVMALTAAFAAVCSCATNNKKTNQEGHLEVPAVHGFEDLDSFAKTAVDIVDWPGQYPYAPEVKIAVGHTADRILIRYDVTEDNPKASVTENNGPVYTDSCCEFFVRVPGSEYYYNFETNCIGKLLAEKHTSLKEFERLSEDQIAMVTRRTSFPDEPMDIKEKTSWYLEIEIPFDLIGCDGPPETLLANFYKCGDKTDKPHYLSWNRIETEKPNFHRPEFFGELHLLK